MRSDSAILTGTALRTALRDAGSREEGIARVVSRIHGSNPLYTWTGVYLLDGEELVLAHQIGKPTPHERIPLDKGICGAAAREGATIVVDDVNSDPRYLACSLETRSEIVVPLKGSDGRILGEIDIDSDTEAAFDEGDRQVLEVAAGILSEFLERPPEGSPSPDGEPGARRRLRSAGGGGEAP